MTPVHPCGVATDYITEEYTQLFKPYRDSEELMLVRWFAADPGAVWFPDLTPYRSICSRDAAMPITNIGDRPFPVVGHPHEGNVNAWTGRRKVGSDEVWRRGAVLGDPVFAVDPDDTCAACGAQAIRADGGFDIGGSSFPVAGEFDDDFSNEFSSPAPP